MFIEFEQNSISNYLSKDYQRYSVWIYDNDNIIQVFEEEKPNTFEMWFEFYNFTYVFWKIMSSLCVEQIDCGMEKISVYNSYKLKKFYMRYMLKDTNYPLKIVRNIDGSISDVSYNLLIMIHPRILRTLFDKINFFENETLSEEEEKRIAKECALLFGKNEGIVNPHPHVVFYLDLISFWEKFGLNYFDIQKLPYGVFSTIKKMMNLESDFKTKQKTDTPATNKPFGKKSVIKF